MLADQIRLLQRGGLESNGKHGTFFELASCAENFILAGGILAVCAKICGKTKASVGFMG